MSQNVDTIRQGYEAFGRGDLQAATQNFDDDISWENPDAPQLPNPGVTKGKDAVLQAFQEIPQNWDDFRVTPDEFIDGGETVVVLGHTEARGKSTGKDLKVPFVHVWRMSDGKVSRVQLLTDTALAADALGA
jgi:ketosteroid isomerase-like protein